MNEIDPFAYLSRWGAARLIAWWAKPPVKWSSDWSVAIGAVVAWLRGKPVSTKVQTQCDKARAGMAELMLGPFCPDCGAP